MRFAGYAALFGIRDAGGDVIRKGAFARTLAEQRQPIPLFWQHQADLRIGWVERIAEDAKGLRVIASIDNPDGGAGAALKQGKASGLSFGYRARGYFRDPEGRVLSDIHLLEVSLVTHPMQHTARVHRIVPRVEQKRNPYRDPDDGRFTFKPGGGSLAPRQPSVNSAAARTPSSTSAVSHGTGRPAISRSAPASRGSVVPRANMAPPEEIGSRARSIRTGRSELHRMPDMDVVIFGPGVSLSPVPVPSFDTFDSAVRMASRLHDLDAVITGPQFDFTLAGSDALHGQAVVGGRVYGRSAPGLYYFATVSDLDGTKRIEIGKGDPPPARVEVGIGGGVPMLLGGKVVPGYNIAWNSHRDQPSKGKNIIAYNSTSNTLAIFVQKDGVRGRSLRQMVDYIKNAGYDSALMYDGSGSSSLNYQQRQIISPEIYRQPIIPLGIGFRSPR